MPTVTVHHVSFHRHVVTGTHRAQCTCGWSWYGSRAECELHASVHDMRAGDEWEPIEQPEESESAS